MKCNLEGNNAMFQVRLRPKKTGKKNPQAEDVETINDGRKSTKKKKPQSVTSAARACPVSVK